MDCLDYFVDEEAFYYFCGFVLADGHMRRNTRNRGCAAIEIRVTDGEILDKLSSRIKVRSYIKKRSRKTNFTKNELREFKGLYIYDHGFRNFLSGKGVPYGSKKNVQIPEWAKDNHHFWRGYVDGDGSVGVTAKGIVFVGFITSSENVMTQYLDTILKTTGATKTSTRNKRDNVFNIMLTKEYAQDWIRFLGYQETDLCLSRKKNSALELLKWRRQEGQTRIVSKRWNGDQDRIVLAYSFQKAARILNRTESSIKNRAFRLRQVVQNL